MHIFTYLPAVKTELISHLRLYWKVLKDADPTCESVHVMSYMHLSVFSSSGNKNRLVGLI